MLINRKTEHAFGSNPECLGIIIVRDLPPSYAAYRQRLLTLAYKFAKLDENVREQYTDASSSYRQAPTLRSRLNLTCFR